MTRTRAQLLLAAAVVGGLGAPTIDTAAAHGPCGCLYPEMAATGSVVQVVAGYRAYRVVFNPAAADLGIAPDYLQSAYRADVQTTTLLSLPRRDPKRRVRFRVPRVAPGVYAVLIFDGEEGGAHKPGRTSTSSTPIGRRRASSHERPDRTAFPTPRPSDERGGAGTARLLIAAAGGVITGVLIGSTLGRRRRRPDAPS